MENQMSIFDFLCEDKPKEDIPILLKAGQRVFLVNKADVIPTTVLDETWECSETNRGYRLLKDSGTYSCTWNDKFGVEAFTDIEKANAKVTEFLSTHNGVILAENIKPIETIVYSYIRECDNRTMTTFCCKLENDMYYIREFYTYHHICKGNKAYKKFMQQEEIKNGTATEITDFVPNFKNMYRCSEQSDWDYGESEYSCSVG